MYDVYSVYLLFYLHNVNTTEIIRYKLAHYCLGNEFQVTPTERSPTDVTLTCATQSCAITYYRASSPDTVLTGTSGVPLEGLTEALYFYEVNFQCGGFDITVTDNFGICGKS